MIGWSCSSLLCTKNTIAVHTCLLGLQDVTGKAAQAATSPGRPAAAASAVPALPLASNL